MKKEIGNLIFDYICEIIPEKDDAGFIKEHLPQDRYRKKDVYDLHKYGSGAFCKFKIPNKFVESGVYAICIDDELLYIGECEVLSKRFCTGYGNISPKNCYLGGQQTNCRINKLIYEQAKNGKKILLYFHETEKRKAIEKELIEKYNPVWNK